MAWRSGLGVVGSVRQMDSRATLEARGLVGGWGLVSENGERGGGGGVGRAETLQDAQAGQCGRHQVEHDEVRQVFRRRGHGLEAVGNGEALVPRT